MRALARFVRANGVGVCANGIECASILSNINYKNESELLHAISCSMLEITSSLADLNVDIEVSNIDIISDWLL